jgi:hypothetical protein
MRHNINRILTILLTGILLICISGFNRCAIFPPNYRVGLVPPYSDSDSTEHDPSEFLYNSFWKVIRQMHKADVKLKVPVCLFDKYKPLNPGKTFRLEVQEFYSRFAKEKITFLNQLSRHNKVDILFWCTYTVFEEKGEYTIILHGYRHREKLYFTRTYTLAFDLHRQEMIDISKDEFQLLAEQAIEG